MIDIIISFLLAAALTKFVNCNETTTQISITGNSGTTAGNGAPCSYVRRAIMSGLQSESGDIDMSVRFPQGNNTLHMGLYMYERNGTMQIVPERTYRILQMECDGIVYFLLNHRIYCNGRFLRETTPQDEEEWRNAFPPFLLRYYDSSHFEQYRGIPAPAGTNEMRLVAEVKTEEAKAYFLFRKTPPY